MIKAGTILAAAILTLAGAGAASAYVGPSFVQIPGAEGGWKGEPYKNWFKVDGNYWKPRRIGMGGMRNPAIHTGPHGPREGAGELVLSVDKTNPVLAPLMAKCTAKTPIAEITYAESSEMSRAYFEIGNRPAEIPEYFEYKLKDVTFADCPVVAEAPQQAFVVAFKQAERLNYALREDVVKSVLEPQPLAPAPVGGTTRTFVLTWFATAQDIAEDQCPILNTKPPQEAYYEYLSKEAAAKERAAFGEKGVSYENGQMSLRGPSKLDATAAPGIVRDPGNAAPQTTLARGLDLDGHNGEGEPPAGVCKHKNYLSADGRKGIDNQLYTVQGCISSYQGHKGFIMQFANNNMRDGAFAMLIQLSGVDNARNDDNVDVSVFYTTDPMAKSGSGAEVLSDYTFRVSEDPKYTHYFQRVRGRIVDGVVTTEPVKEFRMNLGPYGNPVRMNLAQASMRLELLPDGTMKGVLGGYQDWRVVVTKSASSSAESYHGFQMPGQFNAMRRNADGMKDPVTGECHGISSAFDIEGIPAYLITPSATKKVAQAETRPAQ